MDRRFFWLVLVGLLIGSILTTMLARGEDGEARGKGQWEYKAIVISGPYSTISGTEKIETRLNVVGKDGWELVDFEESTYVFKRPSGN